MLLRKISNKLEVILGNARIKNLGIRFSIKMQKHRGEIAIATSQVALQIGHQTQLISG